MIRYSILAGAALLAPGVASAATSLFTDRAAFEAAVTGLTTHSSATLPAGTTSAVFSNGLTLSTPSVEMRSASLLTSETNGIGDAILINGMENLDFRFSTERYGFGLSLFEPDTPTISGCNRTVCSEATFTFTFASKGVTVATQTLSPANDVTLFFGVLSGVAFDSVSMRETSGEWDNEWFGEFVSADAPSPVPLPLPAVLLGCALGGLRLMRRAA